jgi:DNA-directed RNA polymerase subunit H (RpoH/RPB5)
MSVSVELNIREINIEIHRNVLKMLHRRKLLENDSEVFNTILKDINNKPYIDIKLDNNTYCSIYIINAKLSSISSGTQLDEYLKKNIDVHKIVVIREPMKKVIKQIISEYKNAEIFFEHEMLEDLPTKDFIPEHILLSSEEKELVLKKFDEHQLPLILDTDPMARYYGAKVDDIFKIVRPSITAGKTIYYRRVYYGSLDSLFG